MNVKLKVLRRNKEKGYSDRIYYYFLLTLNICLGIEIINSNIQFHINLQILFLYRNKIWTPVYMHVCTSFFFRFCRWVIKLYIFFRCRFPRNKQRLEKKSHNKTFLMPYIIFKPVSSENMKTSSRRPVIGKGFAINVILNRCNSI